MRRDEGRRDKERRGEGERNFHGDSRNITRSWQAQDLAFKINPS